MEDSNKITEIEYLRGFAILAVVAIHTSVFFTKMQSINALLITNVFIYIFSHFAVPLFVFISAFVLYLKYKNSFSQKIFYAKRAKSILPQYLIFSLIYLLVASFGTFFIDGSVQLPSVPEIIFKFLTASSYYHLWFFALIIQLYLLYPYMIRIYQDFERRGKTSLLLITLFFIQEIWLFFKSFIHDYLDQNWNLIIGRIFISHIFYFVLGIYVCQNFDFVKRWILNLKRLFVISSLVILITLILSIYLIKGLNLYKNFYVIPSKFFIVTELLTSIYYPLIFSVLFMLSIYVLKIRKRFSSIILELSKFSFGIYLIHPLFMDSIVNIIYPFSDIYYYQWRFYVILFISTILLSYIATYLINCLPCSEILIGLKEKQVINN